MPATTAALDILDELPRLTRRVRNRDRPLKNKPFTGPARRGAGVSRVAGTWLRSGRNSAGERPGVIIVARDVPQ